MKDIIDLLGLAPDKIKIISEQKYDNIEEFDDRIDYEFCNDGFCLCKESGKSIIDNIFFHSKNYGDGYQAYRGELPLGLRFDMSRAEVHQLCGKPDSSRGAVTVPALGTVPPSDKYVRNAMKISIIYDFDEHSILYTIASID
ncbi:hypothetical protein ACM0P6_11940 [Komagataeibacter sucrofermentans]|uniref:Uncharacterized protein n=1 Tax=Komagataeibacter sucrofermentans TaxID=1053551 RepID=A0A318QU18_9PROT|nr:hypothetical protein [Komagataeibacter sucrofermentans]PYD78619.1 hypothetical protein CFR77_10015 [Komagataeibacter sucrofermentans]GBQ49893.1 hypothetical protein AA15973_1914 [Komagataeibacter sucrofermentans DSM 15973]